MVGSKGGYMDRDMADVWSWDQKDEVGRDLALA